MFNDASIRSSLDIGEDQGTSDATSFHVDSNGNMWSGSNSTSFSVAPFRVTNTGDVTANSLTLTGRTSLNNSGNASIFLTNNVDGIGLYSDANTAFYVDATDKFSLGNKLTWANSVLTVQGVLKLSDGSDVLNAADVELIVDEFGNEIQDGFIGGLTITANAMYYGTGTFANGNTAFYVGRNASNQANFSLGNKLTWDGTTLSITGNVAITGGTTYTTIQNAYNEANSASDAAGIAYSTAIDAKEIAVSAQGTADDAYYEASTKIGPGTLIAEINGAATTINGDQITTGTLNADRISGGTIRASTSFIAEGSGTFTNSDGSFYVDAGGGCSTNYIRSSVGNLALDINGADCNMVALGSPAQSGFFRVYGNLRYITIGTISDERIKNTIKPIESSINFINKLEPVTYYLSNFSHEDTLNSVTVDNSGKRKHFGLIAQDVKVALNDSGYPASEYSLWSSDDLEDENSLQWISYEEIIPHLVKTVQELSAKIEELESRLNS